ncbi:MAG TPA: DNA repair protein RecN [Candidatus Ventrousia excrementavium]|uniref:DNA repair protein RecN n=1 Tax=Candidatus Ventrousia excrementavium TaxID=2840961 RepID=A0A9D1LLX0_9CLOT|nr:DNA repair protein RecN [Candidatus Ventrousia excrementavium]
MLTQLQIENIAVIEHADIDFSAGFSVLSGETGAGKSIIIDALNAVLGSRVSRDLIRTGQSRASVSALFSELPPAALQKAADLGLSTEDGTLLIRREMTPDGRNLCRVNGHPATLSMLRELGPFLVNIHGQHDGQHLLDEQFHIEYLDAFAGLELPLAEYQSHYEELLQLNRRIRALSMSAAEKKRRIEELEGQIAELTDAHLREGERDELLSRRTELVNAERLSAALGDACRLLDGTDDGEGAVALLSMAERALRAGEKLSGQLPPLIERATELSVLASDLASDLASTLSAMAFSPEELEETEQRLELLSRLERKYNMPPDELAGLLPALSQELESLALADESMDSLKDAYAAKRQVVYEQAEKLNAMRAEAAVRLCAQMEQQLAQMDMPSARFGAEIDTSLGKGQTRFTRRGCDTVRFLLSANSGEDLKPLSKVASGGELSRMMLALRNVLSEGDRGVTAVFDEVDAGVSGRAASRVGEKLFSIASTRQVLCVTHLPQIAALADRQYYISKESRGGRTYTRVEPLDTDGRIRELTRLTAGDSVTDAARQNAAEMLRLAEIRKKELLTNQPK